VPVVPCTATPPVFGIVTFDPAAFVLLYPEFAGFITDPGPPALSPILTKEFGLAQLLLNNSCGSRVRDANNRETLLDLLVAHLAFLDVGTNDGAGNIVPPPGVIGRINTATEGAVSVGAEFQAPPNANQAYFIQSKYGALYWTLTAKYRTLLYIGAPQGCGPSPFNNGPVGPFGGDCGC
jgi:Protein of unknown function (DUF4054)